ncbi:MAG: hypothetical protein ACI4DR_00500 [Roseburia sp.]
MYDKNIKKCNLIKKSTDILVVAIILLVSQFVSDRFFDGKFAALLSCMLILMLISTPLKWYIDKKIETHFDCKIKK